MDGPVGSVEYAESDELESLRRRAYGPDADIAGDARAQVRLSELEAARRRQLAGVVVDAAASNPIAEIPTTPWWQRSRFVILGGVIAAVAVSAVVMPMSQLLADGSALVANTSSEKFPSFPVGQRGGYYVPAPDDVLSLKSVGYDGDAPNDRHGILSDLGIRSDVLRRYEDFEGFNVWSGESSYGMVCLFVAVPVQGLREGLSAEGCSLRDLDTIADLQKGGDRHIRFVLRGDHVNVYVYKGAADPNASHG